MGVGCILKEHGVSLIILKMVLGSKLRYGGCWARCYLQLNCRTGLGISLWCLVKVYLASYSLGVLVLMLSSRWIFGNNTGCIDHYWCFEECCAL